MALGTGICQGVAHARIKYAPVGTTWVGGQGQDRNMPRDSACAYIAPVGGAATSVGRWGQK